MADDGAPPAAEGSQRVVQKSLSGARTPGYALEPPHALSGYFPSGSELDILGKHDSGMLRVRFTSRSGRVVEVLCRPTDLDSKEEVGETDDAWRDMNKLFNLPLWGGEALWGEPEAAVASRLKWPRESRTTELSSYRYYPNRDERVLGARPYSLALQAENGRAKEVSMVFVNSGDFEGFARPSSVGRGFTAATGSDPDRDILKAFRVALKREAAAIREGLTSLLGEPVRDRFGKGRDMREKVWRWDWEGHAVLLAVPKDEYVSVRVIPSDAADRRGKAAKIDDAALKRKLASRVERRANGDVLVGEIPMIDQGPKGYCVPATWARYMRYMGIPADMYALAMAGKTLAGGGTVSSLLADNVNDVLQYYGRRLKTIDDIPELKDIAKYTDQGLPLIWDMRVDEDLNREITRRSVRRRKVGDWSQWANAIREGDKQYEDVEQLRGGGHVCMIFGYNRETGEIAVTDSWGQQFVERWFTPGEVRVLSQGQYRVIRW